MKNYDDILLPGEEVLFRTRKHLIVLLGPALSMIIGALCLLLLVFYGDELSDVSVIIILLLLPGCILLPIGLFRFILSIISVGCNTILVTDKRLIICFRLLSTETTSIIYGKCEEVSFGQGLLDRWMDCGRANFTMVGGGTNVLATVRHFRVFRKVVDTQIMDATASYGMLRAHGVAGN